MSTTAPQLSDWDGRGVRVADVLDELGRLRRTGPDEAPMTLAGVLNLIAYAPDPECVPEMEDLIHRMSDHQPSRAVIVAADEGSTGIDAQVGISCRLAGEDTSVAVELVTLTLRGSARHGAGSAVVPLMRADLPTFLWWPRSPEEVHGGVLRNLLGLAHRVVCEAGRDDDAARGVTALARLAAAPGPAPTDLAWAAITPWRQLVAQVVDSPSLVALRDAPSLCAVAHGDTAPTVEALLMAGWLRDLIGPRLMIEMHGRPADAGRLVAVELEGAGGRRLAIERVAGRDAAAVLVTEPGGEVRRRVLPLPQLGRAALLAGELELQRPDRPFERALPHAVAVARA